MRVTRVYHPGRLSAGSMVEVDEASSRRLARVLRADRGESLVLFDGNGAQFPARILEMGRLLTVELGEQVDVDLESPLTLTLLQGIARGDHMDFAIRKATELGVTRIVPVIASRTQASRGRSQLDRRMDHWKAVIVSACEQCGRNTLAVLEQPQALGTVLGQPSASESLRLVLTPEGDVTLRDIPRPDTSIELLIGPEGGLTQEEVEGARAAGFQTLRLGPRVLRTETAALSAIAIIQALWGDL